MESALTAMLGRQAAYTGREVTLAEVQRSNEHWESGLDVNRLGSEAAARRFRLGAENWIRIFPGPRR